MQTLTVLDWLVIAGYFAVLIGIVWYSSADDASGKLSNPAWLAAFGDFNFLYFSSILFPVTAIIIALTSLLTAPPSPEKISGLTFGSMSDKDRAELRASWNRYDIWLTFTVIGLVLGIYLYFSLWV